jgi:hypothetical protein
VLGGEEQDMSDMIDPMMGDSIALVRERETGVSTVTSGAAGAVLDRSGQQRLALELVRQAKEQGADLIGSDGLLAGLTKRVLEAALEAEMIEHLGYEAHDPDGRNGQNSRNGKRAKTVLIGLGRSRSRSRVIGRARSSR